MTGVRLRNTQNDTTTDLPLMGVFIAIGHQPNTQIFADQLDMQNGYLRVRGGLDGFATQTSIEGVFAAGDVADPPTARPSPRPAPAVWPPSMPSAIWTRNKHKGI